MTFVTSAHFCVLSGGQKWEEISQSQIKKVKKIWVREGYKQDKAEQRLVRCWQNLFCNQQKTCSG